MESTLLHEKYVKCLIDHCQGYEVKYDQSSQLVVDASLPLELRSVIPDCSSGFHLLDQGQVLPMGAVCSQARLNYSVCVVHHPACDYPWRLWLLPDSARVEGMVRSLGLPIIHFDKRWCADYVNVEAADILGVTAADLIDRGWLNYFPHDVATAVVDHFSGGMGNVSTYVGNFQYISPLGKKCILQLMASQYLSMENGETKFTIVLIDYTVHREAEDKLRHMALHDSMTQLLNRHAFIENLESLPRETLINSALVFIDVDNFKEINDTYGHHAGDQVITITGLRLVNNLRHRDLAARFGGDEFVVMILGASEDGVQAIIRKLSDTLNKDYQLNTGALNVEFSIGYVYVANQHDVVNLPSKNLIDGLLERADLAMYKAKQEHGTHCVPYDKGLKEESEKRKKMNLELDSLLTKGSLLVHFQPIFRSGYIVSVEALLREPLKYYGSVSELIIDIARSKNPQKLYQLLMKSTLLSYKEIVSALPESTYVPTLNLNVEVSQLKSSTFIDELNRLVADCSVEAHKIFIEITETGLEDDPEEMIKALSLVKKSGFNLSVDDFGTGYSSMKRLTQSNFNQLKIDRYFLTSIHKNKKYQAMLKSIIVMCNDLHIEALAEGVESEDEVKLLESYGVDIFQGFFFSQPLSSDDVISSIIEKNSHG